MDRPRKDYGMKNLSLAVDVGNSQISLGVFEKSALLARTDFKTKEFEINPFLRF